MKKNTFKKAITGTLLGAMLVTSISVPTAFATTTVSGGYTMASNTYHSALTNAQKQLFKKATSGLDGVGYKAVSYLGKSAKITNNKRNYYYLSKATPTTANPVTEYKIVVVTKNSKKHITYFNKAKNFTLGNYTSNKKSTDMKNNKLTVNSKSKKAVMKGIVKTAFNKASKKYTKLTLKPMAYLGSQVVSGTNYQYLCSGYSKSTGKHIYVVTVYNSLSNNAKVTSAYGLY